MTIRKIYIAEDGEEFESEDECLEYEKAFNPEGAIVFYDEDLERVTSGRDPAETFELADHLYISNAEQAERFFNWIDEYYGMTVPDEVVAGQVYSFDERNQQYFNLCDRIREMEHVLKIIFEDLQKNGGACRQHDKC